MILNAKQSGNMNKEKVGTVVLVLCALVVTGVVVSERLKPEQPAPNAPNAPRKVTKVENWAAIRDSFAVSIDPPAKLQLMANARGRKTESGPTFSLLPFVIDITTFTDFECPFCLITDSVTRVLAGPLVTRHVVHLPIPGHRQAMPAARALECADQEGQAHVMHQALYARQAELGVEPWARFALHGELEDSTGAQLVACMASAPDKRIRAGEALAKRLNITGTPTVIISQGDVAWLVSPSTPEHVETVFKDVLARRTPK